MKFAFFFIEWNQSMYEPKSTNTAIRWSLTYLIVYLKMTYRILPSNLSISLFYKLGEKVRSYLLEYERKESKDFYLLSTVYVLPGPERKSMSLIELWMGAAELWLLGDRPHSIVDGASVPPNLAYYHASYLVHTPTRTKNKHTNT